MLPVSVEFALRRSVQDGSFAGVDFSPVSPDAALLTYVTDRNV